MLQDQDTTALSRLAGTLAFRLVVCSFILAGSLAGQPVGDAATANAGQNTNPRGLDFFRVSGNITTGVMISKQNQFAALPRNGTVIASTSEDFSKANLYLGLHLNRTWKMGEKWQIDNLFDARLTAIPVQTSVAANAGTNGTENGNGNGNGGNGQVVSDPNSFLLSSRKAAQMQLGVYVPIIGPVEDEAQPEVDPSGNIQRDRRGRGRYYKRAFYIAPIGKIGIQTLTEGQESAEMARYGQDDVYNFWAVGGRIGVLRRWYRSKTAVTAGEPPAVAPGAELDKNRGAESLLHLDFMYGRYENFTLPENFRREENDTPELRAGNRLPRYAFEGRLRLPYVPYTFIGFDANLGKGRDDVRFIFGINIELGPIVSVLNPR